jgi:hypothetical protein
LFLHREPTGKRFELFKEMLRTVKRVAVLSDPLAAEQLRAVEAANRSMGLMLQSIELPNPSYGVESAFRAALRSRAEALLVLTTLSHLPRALENRTARPEEPVPDELRAL